MNGQNKSMARNGKAGSHLCSLIFDKLLKNIEGAVVITDSKGFVRFANNAYFRLFNIPKKNVLDKYWIGCIGPKDECQRFETIFNNIKKKKALRIFETCVLINKKKKEYFCWTSIPLKENQRCFYMFIGRKVKHASGVTPSRCVNIFQNKFGKNNAAHQRIVKILFDASSASEPATAEHSRRVMSLAVSLARELKLGKERIARIKAASLLHDLGKLVVDRKILFKNRSLSKKEFEKMKRHAYWSTEIVRFVYFLRDIALIIADHHENYDGTGYPRALKTWRIPLEAKILSTVDIYEALTADRPYRKGFPKREAIAIMEKEKGHKLDPKITDVFLNMGKRGRL